MNIKIDKTDALFSRYLREKRGRCEICGRENGLQVSHFFGRRHENTRYDPENVDVLCASCHFRFHERPADYVVYKKKKLGEKAYKDLETRAILYKKRDRKLDYLAIKKLYDEFKKDE